MTTETTVVAAFHHPSGFTEHPYTHNGDDVTTTKEWEDQHQDCEVIPGCMFLFLYMYIYISNYYFTNRPSMTRQSATTTTTTIIHTNTTTNGLETRRPAPGNLLKYIFIHLLNIYYQVNYDDIRVKDGGMEGRRDGVTECMEALVSFIIIISF